MSAVPPFTDDIDPLTGLPRVPPGMPPQGPGPGAVPPTLGPGGPGPGGMPPQGPGPTMPPPTPQVNPAIPVNGPGGGGGPGKVDPNVVNAMLSLNQLAPREAQLQRQQLLADKLRASSAGMSKSQSPINTPNWAGALGTAIGGIKANQMDEAGKEEGKLIGADRAKSYESFMRGLQGLGPKEDPTAPRIGMT